MLQAVQAATSLLKAHRTHGHLAARLDPLGTEPEGDPALEPTTVGLSPEVMAKIPAKILRMYVPGATLADALPHLRETYCGTIAYEIEHIASHRQRMWLREKIEGSEFRKPLTNDEQHALLQRLVEVDALERFMHKAYLGQKQFSIEGLDMTVPMLDEIIQLAAAHGAREVVVGMAHRGRLNVLAHNLGPPVRDDLRRVRGRLDARGRDLDPAGRHRRRQVPPRRPGHLPAAQRRRDPRQPRVQPVAPGVRAPGRRRRHARGADRPPGPARPPRHQRRGADRPARRRAMPGQGVVAESLNLQALDGYKVGGTIHLVQNNQVGFTTDPEDARSTRWASDIAKGYDTPIIHVNADDVAACVAAVRLAFAFREEFGHDVVIDLIGYRASATTRPTSRVHAARDVRKIKARSASASCVPRGVRPRRRPRPHRLSPLRPQRGRRARVHAARDVRQDQGKKRVSELWAERLVEDGVLTQEEVEQQRQDVWDELTRLHQDLKQQIKAAEDAGAVEQATGEYQLDRSPSPEVQTAVSPDRLRSATGEYQLDRSPSPEVQTAVSPERLRSLNDELLRVPDGFTVHPKLVKQLERRRQAVGADGGIDWAHAESLAFSSLLTEGVPIRLTGQDVERGTFSQRHMVLHDAKTGQTICPIQSLPGALAPFELHNSPLSEIACLGFEYGYSAEAPETLVLWEAQFGDFGNAAQVIIDQFIVSGLAKWGQTTRLTLLLPHGYEGSGPEHSSGRLERFLQLAAEGNIRVANLTTPAQYFHLLRRQARIAKQRPLIIMTPKSLLRLPQATNRLEHLSETRFFPVLGEPRVNAEKVTRLVLCTGKIYYDLVGHPSRQDNEAVAIGRVELLYPFPEAQILELVNSYPNLREVVWVQEEPRNMGARAHMSPRLMQILPQQLKFGYIGRPERASPGEGYPAAHTGEQNRILRTALDLGLPVTLYPAKLPGDR